MFFWFHFLSLYIGLYVCMFMFNFVNHVLLWFRLCAVIVMFLYFYCYVYTFLYILFSLCGSMYCLCVNVYMVRQFNSPNDPVKAKFACLWTSSCSRLLNTLLLKLFIS